MKKHEWVVSGIFDDGRIGIVNFDNEIIVPLRYQLSRELAALIVDAHNEAVRRMYEN